MVLSESVLVTVFSARGYYPDFHIRRRHYRYEASTECCWAAVIQPPVELGEWGMSEVALLMPREVALQASIMLSRPDPVHNGFPTLHILGRTQLEPGAVGGDLRKAAAGSALRSVVGDVLAEQGWRQPGRGYSLTRDSEATEARNLLTRLDDQDPLLVAGLSRLLAATRLFHDPELGEEASVALFLAMSSGVEFVRQALQDALGEPTSVRDHVWPFLRRHISTGDHFVDFLDYMWDVRTAAIHPSSRVGEYWTAPVMASDFFWLRKQLVELYRLIVVGPSDPSGTSDPVSGVDEG